MDLAIAQLFNYRRKKAIVPTSGSKPEEIKVTWTDPNGGELQFGVVPRFTESLDAAKSLFDYALPGMAGGFSYHSGYAKATVADGEVVTAFNPATAICLATIKAASTSILQETSP